MRTIVIAVVVLLSSFCEIVTAQTTYIVCVGLDVNRDNVDPLPCSKADVKGLAKFYHNYNGSKVFMLLDANATRSHILKVLKQHFAKSTAKDEIIFAYSGHGFDGGLSTYNNNEVLYCSEVQEIMQSCEARRKMMFVMSCHSGSFTKKFNNNKDRRRRYNKKSNVLLFLSSEADEYSWESYFMENSYFYHYLLDGLKGGADKNGDNKVTARELFNYVAPNVTSISGGIQHPVMWGRFPDDMVIVNVK
ncbi:MAG: caspase domain-containing protein [Muribaculaceae bacterium]